MKRKFVLLCVIFILFVIYFTSLYTGFVNEHFLTGFNFSGDFRYLLYTLIFITLIVVPLYYALRCWAKYKDQKL